MILFEAIIRFNVVLVILCTYEPEYVEQGGDEAIKGGDMQVLSALIDLMVPLVIRSLQVLLYRL